MRHMVSNERGYAMVIALAFITGLTLLAGIIIAVATTEKRTAFNELAHTRSFYSADAGSEVAINWLRIQNAPPAKVDAQNHVFVPSGYDTLPDGALYRHDIEYRGVKHRKGWDSKQYLDFSYQIESEGTSISQSEAEVEVQALRLFKVGY